MGARFEALNEGVLMAPLHPRYTHVGFNMISVQVCWANSSPESDGGKGNLSVRRVEAVVGFLEDVESPLVALDGQQDGQTPTEVRPLPHTNHLGEDALKVQTAKRKRKNLEIETLKNTA